MVSSSVVGARLGGWRLLCIYGGWQSWANDLQLLLAGIAVMVAFDQVTLWRWEGRRSSARLIVLTALSVAAVLATNMVLLQSLGSSHLDLLMGLRTVFIASLVLSTLPLAGALAAPDNPRACGARRSWRP